MPFKAVLGRLRRGQRVLRKVQQPLQLMIKLDKAWPFEQPVCASTGQRTGRSHRQIHDQHVVVPTPGKGMSLAAGHHTRVQTIDRPALPLHLKIRAATQADHQLVLGVGMGRGLNRQIENACVHAGPSIKADAHAATSARKKPLLKLPSAAAMSES